MSGGGHEAGGDLHGVEYARRVVSGLGIFPFAVITLFIEGAVGAIGVSVNKKESDHGGGH